MPPNLPGEWTAIGRTTVQTTSDSATVEGGYIVSKQIWSDSEISFRAKTPTNSNQVQIWGGFRYRDRDSRYVFGLRGGNDNDLYIARYAPDGKAEFLGFAPLDFQPVPGTWYHLRVVTSGNHFLVFLNDEKLPRINVVDQDMLWDKGSVCFGGGWLPAEFADLQVRQLSDEDKSEFLAIGNSHWTAPGIDKESLRISQRAKYVPTTVTNLSLSRTQISLDGNWLFSPDYETAVGQAPIQLNYNDQSWHVMPVPAFWTPGLSWLYGETDFSNLDEYSITKGVAESLYVREIKRCDAYTFDWHKINAAWYRHYLDLPSNLGDRHFEITFDAVAKVSEIWVNGIEVGAHTGMFGEIVCDITKAVRPGQNVIVVHVISRPNLFSYTTNKVEGVAVTVKVTSSMLYSLPHGMFQENVGGIWQPVKLTITSPILVNDVFIEPTLHGASLNLDILNAGHEQANVDVNYVITSAQDESVLYSNQVTSPLLIETGAHGHLTLETPRLNPKLWSPEDPNLYQLNVLVWENGQEIDNYKVRFGFRTFAVDGSKLLLNGHPYWLRGANPFPHALYPNDSALAHDFLKIAREGNINVTRTHIAPFTTTWLDAADEVGMGVSFEGTWPWLMLQGEPPDPDLLKCWKDEYISLIHENRNHPSILLWTVNNEMKFPLFETNYEMLRKKWLILNDVVKSIRQADPTRPIVVDSSYVRKEANRSYQSVVKPNHFDDGDIDDRHSYYGWYEPSFFNFYNGKFGKTYSTHGRPLISQEMSTGYPNNDDGHPVRSYIFINYTPQALVGDDAYENADPAIFLKRQAFMTKELAETMRRTSHESAAGILMFSYLTWFQIPWSETQIKPWPAYFTLKTAFQPILVSAELYGRHFYAGDTIRRRVCIVNDAEDDSIVSNSDLVWEFKYDNQTLTKGLIKVPSVSYYQNRWLNANFFLPTNLPEPRIDGQLVLRLESHGKLLSKNSYDLTVASTNWTQNGIVKNTMVQVWSPRKQVSNILVGLPIEIVKSISAANPTNILIIGSLRNVKLTAGEIDQLRKFVFNGGHVLMLHPGSTLRKLFPGQITAFKRKDGEIVTMCVPESPVFSGIDPLDLAWFEQSGRQLPIACSGVFQISPIHQGITPLAWQCDFHGYLESPTDVNLISGYPLLEIQLGRGRLLASELYLETAQTDPIARRLLMNAISYLGDKP